jgi:hypothetical protein
MTSVRFPRWLKEADIPSAAVLSDKLYTGSLKGAPHRYVIGAAKEV